MDRLRTNTYRDGFDVNLYGVGTKPINFATNLIGFAAPPCGFRSFPYRFERERIGFEPPTVGFGSFLCGIESFPGGMKSFPCGNEPFPHRNDLQQLHEESIEWGRHAISPCGTEFFGCRFKAATIRFNFSTIHLAAST